jgi:hypothetical protein
VNTDLILSPFDPSDCRYAMPWVNLTVSRLEDQTDEVSDCLFSKFETQHFKPTVSNKPRLVKHSARSFVSIEDAAVTVVQDDDQHVPI